MLRNRPRRYPSIDSWTWGAQCLKYPNQPFSVRFTSEQMAFILLPLLRRVLLRMASLSLSRLFLRGRYPASSLLRRLCHLPGTVLRALLAAMNAVPSRLVIPDSYRSNFQPFYLQPPHAFLSFCSLCSPGIGRGFSVLPSRVGFRLGFVFKKQTRQCIRPNRVHRCFVYGLVVRFRLLPTPPLDDAVAFCYGQTSASVR